MGSGGSQARPSVPQAHQPRNAQYEQHRDEDPDVFEGPASKGTWPILALFRSDSVEVTNDPRIFLDNVISKRLAAFETVVVASVLVASVSCSTILVMEESDENWVEFLGLVGMTLVFIMNLFTVLVLTQQYYQTFRLITSGSTGFEIAKSYYLNPNIATLRHMATHSFFKSIPIFVGSIGVMVFDKLGRSWSMSIPVLVVLSISALVLMLVNKKHADIFREKYVSTKDHEAPLKNYVNSLSSLGPSSKETRARVGAI